jgi:uncharacterized protein (TIGR02118 family)
MGLEEIRVLRGVGTPDGGPLPWRIVAELTFTSLEALQAAITTHGPEIFGHIPRYTDIPATMQVSERMA